MSKSFSRFQETVLEFLDNISSCVDDLHSNKMTTMTADKIIFIKSILGKYPQRYLLDVFIENHASWEHIHKRDNSFIVNDVPVIYESIGGDIINVIVLPFDAHLKSKTKGISKCPVTDEDIDYLWQYFESMVRIACNFIFNNHATIYEDIDLVKYSQMFGFELVRE